MSDTLQHTPAAPQAPLVDLEGAPHQAQSELIDTQNLEQLRISSMDILESEVIYQAPRPQEESQEESKVESDILTAHSKVSSQVVQQEFLIDSGIVIDNGLEDSQMTTHDVKASVTQADISSDLRVQMERYQVYSSSHGIHKSKTIMLVKEAAPLEGREQDKAESKYANEKYYMGYFKWYWGEYGIWTALKNFFGAKVQHTLTYNFFYNFGLAIGGFFFRRFLLNNVEVLKDYVK